MRTYFQTALLIMTCIAGFGFMLPQTSFAQNDYVPLSPIPFTSTADARCYDAAGNVAPCPTQLTRYVTGIYRIAIAIAGVLAVMVIIWEGIRRMATDSFTTKSDTLRRIQAALAGLLLALMAYLFLNVINPKIVSYNLNLTTVPQQPALNPVQPTAASTLQPYVLLGVIDKNGNYKCPLPQKGFQPAQASVVLSSQCAADAANTTGAVTNQNPSYVCCKYFPL